MAFPLAATAARQARALEAQGHGPWPAPGWPWSVAQTLADDVFCGWTAAPEALALAERFERLDRLDQLVWAPKRQEA